MIKRIHKQIGLVCTNCGHYIKVDLGFSITDNDRKTEEPKAGFYDTGVWYSCPSCGCNMSVVDVDLTEMVAAYNKAGYRTKFSCQGRYRIEEFFDVQEDDDVGPYMAELKLSDPYLFIDLTKTPKEKHLPLIRGISEEIVHYYHNPHTLSSRLHPVMSIYTLRPDSLGSCAKSSTTLNWNTFEEYRAEAARTNETQFIPAIDEAQNLHIHIPWPELDSTEITFFQTNITQTFLSIMNGGLERAIKFWKETSK